MSADALKTLFHPFEAGLLEAPSRDSRVLFLGAKPGFRPPEGFPSGIDCVQGFRPDFLALQKAGHAVSPRADGDGYDLCLVLAGRHRGQNELWLADAIRRVTPAGRVVMAGAKTDGIAALRKRLASAEDSLAAAIGRERPASPAATAEVGCRARMYSPFGGKVPLEGHLSKHHGLAFWLRRTPAAEAFAQAIRDWYAGWPLIDGRFRTAPGMFSHDRVDAGSRLLAGNLPAGAAGDVADFGAGWGFLAVSVAERLPAVRRIDLYEADFGSAEAARTNMARLAPGCEAEVFWADLETEPPGRRYDWIVMNPPFHHGRAAEPAIGRKMIGAAAAALKPGGSLVLVANRQLPYEATLAARFSAVREIARDASFKVLLALR